MRRSSSLRVARRPRRNLFADGGRAGHTVLRASLNLVSTVIGIVIGVKGFRVYGFRV